jgi:chromosome segregation ATPase
MASPRELAQKAFTLLQDALRESESRATELDAELKRKREPKNRIEERLDVLTHRLEGVEVECQSWQHKAGNLEELLENERVRVQQLKKKLEVAESGPDKVGKKEVNFWRQRAELFDAETREYKQRIASLKQELESRAAGVEGFSFEEPTGAESDLVGALEAAREEASALRLRLDAQAAELKELEARLADTDVPVSRAAPEATAPDGAAAEMREQVAALETALTDSEQARAALGAELGTRSADLERVRRELDENRKGARDVDAVANKTATALREREARLVELSAELEKTRTELGQKGQQEHAARASLEKSTREIAERDRRIQALSIEGERARTELGSRETDAQRLRATADARERELEQTRAAAQRLQAELADLRKRGDTLQSEHRANLESWRVELGQKEVTIRDQQAKYAAVERERAALEQTQNDVREQISGLEAELKEEKECTANLSEVANERKEALTRLEEKIEEVDERYEEAKWQLGKAQHFERLVRRRKGLINALIAALRAKSKANSALKAGLDGLRTYKATSEANQHKLLARVDKLSAELSEAEETISKRQGATLVNEELQAARAKITTLETRLNTQVDIIQTLENELKAGKAMQHARADLSSELEDLRKELEAKNGIIARIEADADEQQRKLAKLRGSEGETMRLKAIEEKDKGLIDTLQREITTLRETLARHSETAGSGNAKQGDMADKLKERDGSITRLMSTVKDKDAEIAKLKESAAHWKKKYEFLSTEAPDAYQSVVEK